MKKWLKSMPGQMLINYLWTLIKLILWCLCLKVFTYCADYIVINQTRIQEVKETKFLGVIIDNKLKWSAHISYISKKISKGIRIILKSRKVFSNETLLSLYHTFVYPYLSYCIYVWGKAYKTHLNELFILKNKAMRIINGVPPRTNMDNYLHRE